MFVLLNGSFGIGKTTTAEALVRAVPGAALYDPERVGYVLRRLPAWVLGVRAQPDDYQHLWQWRSLIASGCRRRHGSARAVIVPMAFTERSYFDAFATALQRTAEVQRICLVAPPEVVAERLKQRAAAERRDVTPFETRRAAECAVAHRDPAFGVPVDASGPVEGIVAEIRRLTGL